LMASNLWAAGSCTETDLDTIGGAFTVKLACTGDSANGSIPTQTISSGVITLLSNKYFLVNVKAYPTSGGTAPDAADVTVNMDGLDLLGGKGVNLIHATATQDVVPYSTFMSAWRYVLVTSALTVAVANQATNSANYTIELQFSK
jgi:hypothetical protein